MNLREFTTLVRREYWEHRSLLWVPLGVAALIVLGTLFGTHVTGTVRISLDGDETEYFTRLAINVDEQRKLFAVWIAGLSLPVLIAALFACFGYLLDSLYAERKDRSILFWRSLPVSDRDTVLAKFFVAMVATPLLVWAVSLVTSALTFVLVSAKVSGTPLAPLGIWHGLTWLGVQWTLLQNLLVASLWYSPIAAYLMLVSVYAKRSPWLWVSLPPLIAVIAENLLFGTKFVPQFIGYRLFGFFRAVDVSVHAGRGTSSDAIGRGVETAHERISAIAFLGDPNLWLGVFVCVALLVIVMRTRRLRGEA